MWLVDRNLTKKGELKHGKWLFEALCLNDRETLWVDHKAMLHKPLIFLI